MIVTALALAPSFLVALGARGETWRRDGLKYFTIVLCYLVFGAVAGALTGVYRRQLSRLSAAVMLGSVIGAAGSLALSLSSQQMRGIPGVAPELVMVGLGAFVGAILGWWGWRLGRQYKTN